MERREAWALGEFVGGASVGLSHRVRDLHAAIARRAFGAVGTAGEPVRAVHDEIADRVYAAVGAGLGAAGHLGGAILGVTPAPSLESTPAGRVGIGALNGVVGDRLKRPLAQDMLVRRMGRPKRRLAVFVHGLCETEEAWWLHADRHRPYGERLEAELGYTGVYVRYNSGRGIAENGREFARLLDQLVEEWPVDVEEIVLIGHSMGGLVARCACYEGADASWVSAVRHVFMLGTPHHGAPLAKAARAVRTGLALLPETRVLATALELSDGIHDLAESCEYPYLRTANHYFIAATISHEPTEPLGRLVGDLLVLPASAWGHGGRGQRLEFPLDNYRHYGGAHHFDLLNHPAIYEQIRTWLLGRVELPETVPPGTV